MMASIIKRKNSKRKEGREGVKEGKKKELRKKFVYSWSK